MTDLRPLVREPPDLVGRDDELTRVGEVLANGESALVLVAGEAGMGKSAFLRELAVQATDEAWTVARSDAAGQLSVIPSTTPTQFDKRLRQMLDLPVAADTSAASGGTSFPPTQPNPAQETGFLAKMVTAVRSFVAPWPGVDELARDIGRRAPVLVLIDGYRPNEAFERAFASSLLTALKRGAEPVIVVVAEREELLSGLTAAAQAVISFGPVDEGAIRPYFEELARDVEPPVSPDELEEYVRATRRRPELIGKLSRLLSLERRTSP